MTVELDDDSLDSIHDAHTALKNIQLETFAVDLEEPNWIRRQRAIQSNGVHQDRRAVAALVGGGCARPTRQLMQNVGVAGPDRDGSERDVRMSSRCNIPLQQAEGDRIRLVRHHSQPGRPTRRRNGEVTDPCSDIDDNTVERIQIRESVDIVTEGFFDDEQIDRPGQLQRAPVGESETPIAQHNASRDAPRGGDAAKTVE